MKKRLLFVENAFNGRLDVQHRRTTNQEKKGTQNKETSRDTGRVSLEHPAGQTGVYRPVFQGLPLFAKAKLTEIGPFSEILCDFFFCQEPRKGGFSKGGFCRVQCHSEGNTKYPRIFGPAVHLALGAPQPREALKGLRPEIWKRTRFSLPQKKGKK